MLIHSDAKYISLVITLGCAWGPCLAAVFFFRNRFFRIVLKTAVSTETTNCGYFDVQRVVLRVVDLVS